MEPVCLLPFFSGRWETTMASSSGGDSSSSTSAATPVSLDETDEATAAAIRNEFRNLDTIWIHKQLILSTFNNAKEPQNSIGITSE